MPPAQDSTRRSFLARAAGAGLGVVVVPGALAATSPTARRRADGSPTERADAAAFLDAVRAGRLDEVRARLATDATLADATDAEARSAIVIAACGGHREVVAALVGAGATIGLSESAMVPDWERLEALVEEDPSRLERVLPVGGTLLYAAARAANGGLYRLQSMGADADGNPRGARGVTPAYGALQAADADLAWRTLVSLCSNGAHVNAPQRGGDTLLHAAARRGDPRIVRYLLRRGADPRALDHRGRSALSTAEAHGHEAAATLLRDPGAVPRDDFTTRWTWDADGAPVTWPDLSDLDHRAQEEVTGPAHFAIDRLRELVDPEPRRAFSRSTQGELAIEASAHTGNHPGMDYLLAHGLPMSLCTAISSGNLARAAAILDTHPGAIHERGPHDFPVMHYPALGGAGVPAAELLLARGAELEQDSLGSTGLHEAAARGRLELAAFLVERGARLDAVGFKYEAVPRTPLDDAEAWGHEDVARFLEQKGAPRAVDVLPAAGPGAKARGVPDAMAPSASDGDGMTGAAPDRDGMR